MDRFGHQKDSPAKRKGSIRAPFPPAFQADHLRRWAMPKIKGASKPPRTRRIVEFFTTARVPGEVNRDLKPPDPSSPLVPRTVGSGITMQDRYESAVERLIHDTKPHHVTEAEWVNIGHDVGAEGGICPPEPPPLHGFGLCGGARNFRAPVRRAHPRYSLGVPRPFKSPWGTM